MLCLDALHGLFCLTCWELGLSQALSPKLHYFAADWFQIVQSQPTWGAACADFTRALGIFCKSGLPIARPHDGPKAV